MSGTSAKDPARMYTAKAAEELARSDRELPGAERTPYQGDALADIMLVKGLPGPAEHSGGPALSGPDGAAADAALVALGFDPDHAFRTVSRPVDTDSSERIVRRLRMQIEAVDARYVIALDRTAGEDVAAALGEPSFAPGKPAETQGHRVLVVDGLEASLADERKKRRVWNQLKRLQPDGPVW